MMNLPASMPLSQAMRGFSPGYSPITTVGNSQQISAPAQSMSPAGGLTINPMFGDPAKRMGSLPDPTMQQPVPQPQPVTQMPTGQPITQPMGQVMTQPMGVASSPPSMMGAPMAGQMGQQGRMDLGSLLRQRMMGSMGQGTTPRNVNLWQL